MIFTLLCSLLASPVYASEAKPVAYGKGVTLTTSPLSLTEALQKREELKGKEIVVKAQVATVCQSEGCWLTLKDKTSEVRVVFLNHSFVIPKDSAKQEAVVQGKLFEKEISAASARHYAKDAKMPAAEIAKIKAPVKQPWFEATGLTLSKR